MPDGKVALYEVYKSSIFKSWLIFVTSVTAAIGEANIVFSWKTAAITGGAGLCGKAWICCSKARCSPCALTLVHNAAADYTDEQAIMERANRLCHMHIHDARGHVNHLPLGEGDVDLLKYLDLAKSHDCRAVLEVKTAAGLRSAVDWLTERGFI